MGGGKRRKEHRGQARLPRRVAAVHARAMRLPTGALPLRGDQLHHADSSLLPPRARVSEATRVGIVETSDRGREGRAADYIFSPSRTACC